MHFGTAATAGVLRGVMAAANLRGPTASFLHTWGAARHRPEQNRRREPPLSWPRQELVIDVTHKAVYAFATGAVADALIPPAPGTSAERPAHDCSYPDSPSRVRPPTPPTRRAPCRASARRGRSSATAPRRTSRSRAVSTHTIRATTTHTSSSCLSSLSSRDTAPARSCRSPSRASAARSSSIPWSIGRSRRSTRPSV